MLKQKRGFTILEIILVVGIIGVLLLVIVPRAYRARVTAKYNIVRQAASELANWGMEWSERNLETQDEADTCVLNDYVNTLVGFTGDNSISNWMSVNQNLAGVGECRVGNAINYAVKDIMLPDKIPRNPFNGLNYLNPGNDGSSWSAGQLNLRRYPSAALVLTTQYHYYFVYYGTDSTAQNEWHAGMGNVQNPPLANLRNGVFMGRLMQ
ncbi:Prepilin-type N-terminal cleavage/methylation domain-containing protein [Candidatus Magnetomoraceae bacterium gMMP-1]